jgi:hypothetical protein
MKNIFWIALLWIGLISSCTTDQPEYALSQQIKLMETIKSFEFVRNETEKVIVEGFSAANIGLTKDENKIPNQLKKKIVSFKSIAFEWNSRLDKIAYELETMQGRLKTINEEAIIYFNKLKAITDSIKDEKMRKLEIQHNTQFKADWNKNYTEGKNALNQLFIINKKGRDVHKVIINDGLRQETNNSLKALRELRKDYRHEMDILFEFTCESARQISIKNATLYPLCDSTRNDRLKKKNFQK